MGLPTPGEFLEKKVPWLWLAFAPASIPIIEFIVRGWLNGPLGASYATAYWLGGTVAVMLLSGVSALDTRAGKWLALLFIAGLVSASVNMRPFLSLPALTLLGACITVFIFSSSLPAQFSTEAMGTGLMAGGALSSLFALHQKFGGLSSISGGPFLGSLDPAVAGNIQARMEEALAFAFFIYPNALGGFLLLSIPLAVAGIIRARKSGDIAGKWGFGLLAALLVSGLYSSGSIGAAVSLLLATGMAVITAGKLRKAAVVPLVLSIMVAVSVWFTRPSSSFSGGMDSKVAALKESFLGWRGTRAMAAGTGPGSYGETVGSRLSVHARSRFAHNWLAETWVETGPVGVIGLGGFIRMIFPLFISAVRGGTGVQWGVAVGWLAMLIHMLVDVDYILPSLVIPWFALSGILASSRAKKITAGFSLPSGGKITAISLFAALFISTLLQGAWSAVFLGIVLGIAVAFAVIKSLLDGGIKVLAGKGDVPLLLLLIAGVLWLAVTPAIARTWPSYLEAVGLVCVVLVVRRISGSKGRMAGTAPVAVSVFAFIHGTWALIEGLATGKPAFTSFPSPNFLGAFLVAGLGLSAWSSLEKGGRGRILYLFAAIASLAGVVASRSSGALLAAGLLMSVVTFVRGGLPGANRFRWRAASVILALVMSITAIPPVSPVSVLQRITIWHEGALALRENPFGSGPGTYPLAVAPVRLPSYTYAGLARYSLRADFAHCEPLQAGVEWGLPALGLMAWLAVCVVSSLSGGNYGWGFALLGLLLHSLVDFPFRAPPIELLSAIALGMVTASWKPLAGTRQPPPGTGIPATGLILIVAAVTGLGMARQGIARLALEAVQSPAYQGGMGGASVVAVNPLNPAVFTIEGYLCAGAAVKARQDGYLKSMVQRGDEMLGLAEALSGDRFIRLLSPFPLNTREEFPSAARESDIVSHPRNLLFHHAVYSRLAGRRPAGSVDTGLAGVSAVEPFYLPVYMIRGNIAVMNGDRKSARHLFRKALLLSREAGKRVGLNDYEKDLVGIDRAEAESALERLK